MGKFQAWKWTKSLWAIFSKNFQETKIGEISSMILWESFVRDFRQWFLENKIWGNFKLKIGQKVFEWFSAIIFRKRKLGNFGAWFCKNILLEISSNKFRETKNRETSSIIDFEKTFLSDDFWEQKLMVAQASIWKKKIEMRTISNFWKNLKASWRELNL